MLGSSKTLRLVWGGCAAFVLVCAASGIARAEDEAVILKNGDRLTGTIKEMKDGKLIFENDIFDELSIDFEDVEAIQSKEEHRVRLKNGETVFSPIDMPLSDIEAINPVDVVWAGFVKANVFYTAGNTRTRGIGVGSEVTRTTDIDRLKFYLSADYRQNRGETDVQQANGGVNYRYDFAECWFAAAYVDLLHDRLKELNIRTTAGFDLGHFFFKEDDFDLSATAGVAYIDEDFEDNDDDDNYVALKFGEELNWDVTTEQSIYQSVQYIPNTEDFQDFLFTAVVGYRHKLGGSWFIDFNAQYDHDSQPPEGVLRHDFRTTASLGVNW